MAKVDKSDKVTYRSQNVNPADHLPRFRYTIDERNEIVKILDSITPESGLPKRLPEDTEDRPDREFFAAALSLKGMTTGEIFFGVIADAAFRAVETFPIRKKWPNSVGKIREGADELVTLLSDQTIFPVHEILVPNFREGKISRDECIAVLEAVADCASNLLMKPPTSYPPKKDDLIRRFLAARVLGIYDHLSGRELEFSRGDKEAHGELINLLRACCNPVLRRVGKAPYTNEAAAHVIREIRSSWAEND